MIHSGFLGRFLVIVVVFLVSACGTTRGGQIPYDVASFGPPDAPQMVDQEMAYKLAPLDIVSVLVFNVPELSNDYVVDQSGMLAMPLIGRVEAVGLSTDALSDKIKRGLSQSYIREPDVTVALKASVSRVVTVDGSVRSPGIYPITGNSLTLIQAIAVANGTTELANPKRVAIFRQIEGRQVAAAFDLESIRNGESKNPSIYPGDVVVVDGSGLKQLQRDILQTVPLASTLLFAF